MQEVFQLHGVGVVEDPLVAHVELERLVGETDLLDPVLELAHVSFELAGGQGHLRDVEESFSRQLGAVLKGLLVGGHVLMHGQLGGPCPLLIGEVVLVGDHVLKELHGCDRVRARGRTLENKEVLPAL